MHRLNLPLLENITREQRKHQQQDHDQEGPGAEKLLLARFGNICGRSLDWSRQGTEGAARAPSSGSESESAIRPGGDCQLHEQCSEQSAHTQQLANGLVHNIAGHCREFHKSRREFHKSQGGGVVPDEL